MNIPLAQPNLDMLGVLMWGAHLDRAPATLPQGTHTALFTITGGRVTINMLMGQVTTIIGGPNATKLTAYPSIGSPVDLCAAVDINALEVGGKLIVPGVSATALTKANAGAIISTTTPFVVEPGAIHLDCAGSVTGSVQWAIWWHPFDDGALLVAA
jgi:hypothetical protein